MLCRANHVLEGVIVYVLSNSPLFGCVHSLSSILEIVGENMSPDCQNAIARRSLPEHGTHCTWRLMSSCRALCSSFEALEEPRPAAAEVIGPRHPFALLSDKDRVAEDATARLESLVVEAVGARLITSMIKVAGKISVQNTRLTTRKIVHL